MTQRAVLVTGASGFVGAALILRLCDRTDISVTAASRNINHERSAGVKYLHLTDLEADHVAIPLDGVDTIVHCAARVHVMSDQASDPASVFRRINVHATLNLARQAAIAGVRRFVFISSIKVNGEATIAGSYFYPSDEPAPEDPYAISKLEAEHGLMRLGNETGMEVVIIRPPLVYGPGVKGNFASLIKLMAKGIPLPLGAIYNKRSLVGIDNLVDLIIRCIDHPAAANQVFLAGDGEDLSTTELLRSLAEVMGQPARLIPVPVGLLSLGATLLGKQEVARRLLGSLQVDISKAREVLGWEPPVSVKEGLRRCVRDSSV
ncbi:UDP-glucose 4-epimerase family protein [Ectopseudomonas composti]|uniref:UDP-glucose 4-epimerase family protein n=1 Tax=Ectopseudomonas composti TaxID=658457 RepID=UPI0009E0AD7F|nr:SDR family oxidoreductase [Pseudomonas composti]